MRIRTFHVYNKVTGLFTGKTMRMQDAPDLEKTIAGSLQDAEDALYEGDTDPASYRIVNGRPVAWQPPAPSEHHVWNHHIRRWHPGPEMEADAAAQRDIATAEAIQHRATREALIHLLGAEHPLARKLVAIEDTIAVRRTKLIARTGAK